MKIPDVLRMAFGIALVLLLAVPLLAQVERASMVGTVRDGTGAVVPGVAVRITHESTNTAVATQSSATGDYTVGNLIPGSYSVTAQHAGFSTRSVKGIVLQVGQTARIDITLEVGAVEQTIEVTGAAPLLQTENATVGQVISADPINAMPLNGRNFVQLAMMAPGVVGLDYAPPGGINGGGRNDEMRPGGTQLQSAGASLMQNQVLIDGIDNSEIVSGTFPVRPMLEGVQEFQVITNNAGAEFGRAGGAVIVISTKSGSNQFHGSLYEYMRNEKFDARNFFDRSTAPIPPYKMNQFGGSLGGPVIFLPRYNGRDRTFFFADFEGQREIVGQTFNLTVPNAAMRVGNFKGVVANGIYDPFSTQLVGSNYTRTRFPDDQVPASYFDPIASKLVNLYPLPQTSALVNNYVNNPSKRSALERADLRIDHQLSPKDALFARYSIDYADFTIPDTFNSDIGGNENSFAGPAIERGQNAVIADTHAFSPTTIGDFRFGYGRIDYTLSPSKLTNPIWGQIPGRDTSDPYQPTAPIISPSGWSGLGDSRSLGCIRREDVKDSIANLTMQKSSHSIKFGGELRMRWVSEVASPQGQNAFGRFNFSGAFTNNPASTSGTGYVGASMLMGLPTLTARELFLEPVKSIRGKEWSFYIRDQWRVKRNLTLYLGVNYTVNTPFVEDNNHWARFDVGSGKLLLAGQNGVSRTADINTDWSGIGPRLSFAWEVTSKTVVRGGFGRFFDPQPAQNNIRQSSMFPFDFIYSVPSGDRIPSTLVKQGFPSRKDLPPDINFSSTANPYGNLRGVSPDWGNAQYTQYNLNVQRRFTGTLALTVGYVGSTGAHLAWNPPVNNPAPGPGDIVKRRPYNGLYPNLGTVSWLQASANTAYDSLQVSAEKRMGHGLYLLANWTWSHARDNASVYDPDNRRREWANSSGNGIDLRHQGRISWRYALPFASRASSSVLKQIVGGWELAGITVLQSGVPFGAGCSSDPTNTGGGCRADVVPGVDWKVENQSYNLWFNPAAFKTPTAYNWGNSGRNFMRGPALYNFDYTLSRRFNLSEQRYVAFRWEAFNAFNTPQLQTPAATIGNVGVGTISATTRANRQMQLALRLVF